MKKHEDQEDVDFEPEDELGTTGALKAKMQKVRDELEQVKKERQEYLDGWQRAKADMVNARRESLASAERTAERLREELVHEIIPALDSFDMASASEQWADIDEGFRTGMEYVKNQLLEALQRHGVTRFGKVGEQFNPNLHEAAGEEDSGSLNPHEIVRVLRSGYKAGERILRPAQVIVSKG